MFSSLLVWIKQCPQVLLSNANSGPINFRNVSQISANCVAKLCQNMYEMCWTTVRNLSDSYLYQNSLITFGNVSEMLQNS